MVCAHWSLRCEWSMDLTGFKMLLCQTCPANHIPLSPHAQPITSLCHHMPSQSQPSVTTCPANHIPLSPHHRCHTAHRNWSHAMKVMFSVTEIVTVQHYQTYKRLISNILPSHFLPLNKLCIAYLHLWHNVHNTAKRATELPIGNARSALVFFSS